jgi:hypothetical protein
MGVLFALLGVLACVLRYVCLCCGGPEPDPDGYRYVVCSGQHTHTHTHTHTRTHTYTRDEHLRSRSTAGKLVPSISLLVLSVLLLIVGYLSLWGDSLFKTSVEPIALDMTQRATLIANQSSALVSRIRAIDTAVSRSIVDCVTTHLLLISLCLSSLFALLFTGETVRLQNFLQSYREPNAVEWRLSM